jgi:hypothetical protein
MAGSQIRRIKWYKSPSAWESAKAWREARRAMVSKFQDSAQTANAAFSNAWSSQITGSASLAANAAIARSQNEIKAAQARAAALQAGSAVDQTV